MTTVPDSTLETPLPRVELLGPEPSESPWRPIETAPRTGRRVLMWSRTAGFFAGNWPQGCAAGDWRKIGGDWRGASDWRAQEATHWMQLPPRPKGESK